MRLLQFAALTAFALPLGGCSTAGTSAARLVYRDATSPAGRQVLADVTGSALTIGLDLAAGDDTGATGAGIQGAARAVRDYEGLATAPSSTTIASAAAAGSGVPQVAATLSPGVENILEHARETAARQNVGLGTDDIVEALARGFDAVADAKTTR